MGNVEVAWVVPQDIVVLNMDIVGPVLLIVVLGVKAHLDNVVAQQQQLQVQRQVLEEVQLHAVRMEMALVVLPDSAALSMAIVVQLLTTVEQDVKVLLDNVAQAQHQQEQ